MSSMQEFERFPLRLSLAQRKVLAEILPTFADRLQTDELKSRFIWFSLEEMKAIHENARLAINRLDSGLKRNSLTHVAHVAEQAVDYFQGIGRIPVKERLYQFKITLMEIKPTIWRRIQTRNCTLDKLHYQIQTAMGWTDSHLHHFKIDQRLYGDPFVFRREYQGDEYYEDSTATTLSQVLPKSGKRFCFEYLYDYGDSWEHEILFEGCLKADAGKRYPICVEGERACPPEDVGGASAYEDFLTAIAEPLHPEHDENLCWVGGSFDPEHFDPVTVTKRMIRGRRNWPETAY